MPPYTLALVIRCPNSIACIPIIGEWDVALEKEAMISREFSLPRQQFAQLAGTFFLVFFESNFTVYPDCLTAMS